MANWSFLNIYHPIEDFRIEDQDYFRKYYLAEQEADRTKPKDGWIGLAYDNFIADFIGLPKSNSNERPNERLKTHASFIRESEDKTLLVHPYSGNVPLGNIGIHYSKEGRNDIPETWRVACMSGEVQAGCEGSDANLVRYAKITLTLPKAIENIEKYLKAAYNLPTSGRLGKWARLAQGCGELNELGDWLALHYLLSKKPNKCIVVLDWGEIAFYYCDDKDIKRSADNKRYLDELNCLEAVANKKGAQKLISNYQQIKSSEVDLIKNAKSLHRFHLNN